LARQSIEKSPETGTRLLSGSQRTWTMADELMPFGPILVVDTRVAALRRTGELLRRAGHDVIEACSFVDGKRLLATRRPALVVSSLRLAAFNGLHLVHLGRLAQPDLNAIIVAPAADAVLQAEAEQVGASLLVEPVPTAALLSLISRKMAPVSPERH